MICYNITILYHNILYIYIYLKLLTIYRGPKPDYPPPLAAVQSHAWVSGKSEALVCWSFATIWAPKPLTPPKP